MGRRFNSASRVHKLLEQARTQPGTKSILEAWTGVFGRVSDQPRRQQAYIASMVGKLGDQLEIAAHQVAETNFSEELYKPVFESLFNALYINVLDNQWSGPQQYLNNYTLNTLALLSEVLENDGTPIDEEDLRTILDQIETFRKDIQASGLSDDVKRFFFEQIDILLNAFREYEVRGNVVFSEALSTAIVSARLRPISFHTVQDEPKVEEARARLTQFWNWIREHSEDIQVITAWFEAAKLVEQGGQIIRHLLSG